MSQTEHASPSTPTPATTEQRLDRYGRWLALIWVYGPCLLFRPEMERAKQARGIQKPARGFVGYFLFPIWAMASDLNELNGL